MLTAENYQLAWMFYLAGSALGLIVFWRMLRALPWGEFKQLLLVSLAAVLLTPVIADPEQLFLAPAWLVFMLQFMFEGPEAAARGGMPLLISWASVLVLALCLQVGYRYYRQRKAARAAQFATTEEEAEQHSALLQESELLHNRKIERNKKSVIKKTLTI